MSLTNATIKERLMEKFGDQVSQFEEPYGLLTFESPKENNLKVLQFLFDDPELRFQPDVFTATQLYSSANWMERETFDFYGVNFVGHPNLIRILNVDEMDYFPMRKQYPLEDQTRVDKDDAMFGR